MTIVALQASVSCRHPKCGGALEEVNPGAADGAVSSWVGACLRCRRQWAVVAQMSPVPSRGAGAH